MTCLGYFFLYVYVNEDWSVYLVIIIMIDAIVFAYFVDYNGVYFYIIYNHPGLWLGNKHKRTNQRSIFLFFSLLMMKSDAWSNFISMSNRVQPLAVELLLLSLVIFFDPLIHTHAHSLDVISHHNFPCLFLICVAMPGTRLQHLCTRVPSSRLNHKFILLLLLY